MRVNAHMISSVSPGEVEGGVTIDELARRADTLVSTIRLYQNKGLIDPPTKRGRVGYYDDGHLDRLRAIAQLQERGFSLAGIKELFDGMSTGDSIRTTLGLGARQSVWSSETPQTMSPLELAALLPSIELTPPLVQRVIDLGLISLSPDGGSVIVHSPELLQIGRRLTSLGIPIDDVLDEYEQLRKQTDDVARRFTELFERDMWKPFTRRGMPAAQIPPLLHDLDDLADLAEEVVSASLRQSLHASAEAFIRAQARRLRIDISALDHRGGPQ